MYFCEFCCHPFCRLSLPLSIASSFLCHLDPLRVVMPWPPCIAVRLWESTQLRTSHSAVSLCPQFGPEATALPFEPQSLSVPIWHRVWERKGHGKVNPYEILHVSMWKTRISINTPKLSRHIDIISIMFMFQTCSADFPPGPGAKPGILRSCLREAMNGCCFIFPQFPKQENSPANGRWGQGKREFDLTLLKSKDSLKNATIECPALPGWHNLAVKKADGNRCTQQTPAQLFAAWSQIMSGNSMWHLPIGIQLHGGTKGCSGFMVNGLWIVAVKPHLFRTERKRHGFAKTCHKL